MARACKQPLRADRRPQPTASQETEALVTRPQELGSATTELAGKTALSLSLDLRPGRRLTAAW